MSELAPLNEADRKHGHFTTVKSPECDRWDITHSTTFITPESELVYFEAQPRDRCDKIHSIFLRRADTFSAFHWVEMKDVKRGDAIYHYYGVGFIRFALVGVLRDVYNLQENLSEKVRSLLLEPEANADTRIIFELK